MIRDGALEPVDESVFEKKPSEMIRIFSAAVELDVPLALRTREVIAERAASNGEALRADPDTGPRFIDFVCDTSDRANPSRIEEMQDLGLLAAIMPEWEPSTGRVQHDIYHVYTVDQHALYAVARLHALVARRAARRVPGAERDDPGGAAPGRAWSWARCCTTWASPTASRTATRAPT